MSNYWKTPATLGLVLVMGACSGSSNNGSDNVGAPGSVSQGSNPAGLTATYDSTTDSLIISETGEADRSYGAIDTGIVPPVGPISMFEGSGGVWADRGVYGETSSGSGKVVSFSSSVPGSEAVVSQLERVGTTIVPTSGTTTYTGSYFGQFLDFRGPGDVEPVVWGAISGDVELTATFADTSTISGEITDRTVTLFNDGDLADLDLEMSTITNGGFTGVASGGEVAGETTSGGTYTGMLTGTEAGEVIGAVEIEHSAGAQRELEVGVFIAEDP